MSFFEILSEAFTLPFMWRAAAVLGGLALAAGIIGVFVNLRGLEFLSDGLTHAVFPGVAAGFAFAGTGGVLYGAIIAAALATVFLTLLSHRKVTTDASIAIILTAMFSIGVIIVSRSHDVTASLEQLLFGHLFTVTTTEVIITLSVCVLAFLLIAFTLRGQVFSAFDVRGAQAAGYRTLGLTLVLNIAIACVVVAASIAVGNLLVLAVIIVPGAISRMWTRGLGGLFIGAVFFASAAALIGLLASFTISVGANVAVPGGATIAIIFVLGYILSIAVRALVPDRANRGDS
jgi:ABC-type Mn2+/Zn2+ transport system permease subunit